jgi:hypothetical protein
MFAKVGQPADFAKAGIIRRWAGDARVLYRQYRRLREQARCHICNASPCGSEPARESNRSDTAESGTNKNGSPTGLPLVVYR